MKTKRIIPVILACISLLAVACVAAKPPKNIISMEQAQAAAMKVYSGPIESKELEREHGKWIYSFDIRGTDKVLHEVQIDAKSGELVSHTTETPKEEATEATSEKKEKK